MIHDAFPASDDHYWFWLYYVSVFSTVLYLYVLYLHFAFIRPILLYISLYGSYARVPFPRLMIQD